MRNRLFALFAGMMAIALMGAGCLDTVGTDRDSVNNNDDTIDAGDQPIGSQDNVDDTLDDEDENDDQDDRVGAQSRNVTLSEQNESGQEGGVLLTEVDGKTRVVLTLNAQPDGTEQPAHIHLGVCPNPGAVLYPLNPVIDGRSETVLNTGLADLLNTSSQLSINVHKSAEESNVYLACGDIDIDGPSDTN